jgi:hypothetical protein
LKDQPGRMNDDTHRKESKDHGNEDQ